MVKLKLAEELVEACSEDLLAMLEDRSEEYVLLHTELDVIAGFHVNAKTLQRALGMVRKKWLKKFMRCADAEKKLPGKEARIKYALMGVN